MPRNWGKKYEEVSKKISKKGKLAAEGHHLKEVADKKLANETTEELMIRTGVENFETGEVVDYRTAYADDNVWGFMNKSFYNKLIADTKLNAKKEVEEEMTNEMMMQMELMMNRVLDARANDARKQELKLAELRVRELELQLELAKYQSAEPVEFELTPFTVAGKVEEVPANDIKERAAEVGIDWDEHQRMSQMVKDFVYIADEKPAKKKRTGRLNKVEELPVGATSTPLNKGRGGYSVAWSKVVNDHALFIDVVCSIVDFAIENNVDIKDTNAFRKFHPVCQGAYIQYTKKHPGRKGVWKEFINKYFSK